MRNTEDRRLESSYPQHFPTANGQEEAMRSSKLLALTLSSADWTLLFLLGIDLLSITTMLRISARFLPGRALSLAARTLP
jgi:hypothetical protein